jgi:hypothetical protein
MSVFKNAENCDLAEQHLDKSKSEGTLSTFFEVYFLLSQPPNYQRRVFKLEIKREDQI